MSKKLISSFTLKIHTTKTMQDLKQLSTYFDTITYFHAVV